MKQKKGFTLIELLIVIAIISILAAMLLPALGMAREKSKQAVCMNNLKHIGIAYAMYTQDYDDCIPTRVGGGTTYNAYGAILWGGNVANAVNAYGPLGLLVRGCGNSTNGFGTGKYISTPAILFCPSTTNLGNGSGVWAVTPTLGNFQTNFENTSAATLTWGSYTVNCDNNNATYTSNADGPYGSGGGTLTRCNTLSGNIANGTAVKRFACAADAFATGSTLGTTNGAAGIYYHQGGGLSLLGCNVLYFDGSVQWWSNNNNILLNTGCPTYGNTKSLGTNTFWTLVENGVAGTKFTGPY